MTEPLPDKNPTIMYLGNLTNKSSEKAAQWMLNKMAEMLGYPDMMVVDRFQLRLQDLAIMREKLIETHTPPTVNRFITTLRGVLRNAHLPGQISEEEYQHLIQQKYVVLESKSTDRELSKGEIAAIMEACDTGTRIGK